MVANLCQWNYRANATSDRDVEVPNPAHPKDGGIENCAKRRILLALFDVARSSTLSFFSPFLCGFIGNLEVPHNYPDRVEDRNRRSASLWEEFVYHSGNSANSGVAGWTEYCRHISVPDVRQVGQYGGFRLTWSKPKEDRRLEYGERKKTKG